jgi:hypothetical protein
MQSGTAQSVGSELDNAATIAQELLSEPDEESSEED